MPMIGNISKILDVFFVECAHLEKDVGQWNVASAKAETHRRGLCVS